MFSGSFSTISFSEVIRLLSASSQTGGLHLYEGEYLGSVFLQIGQLAHAEFHHLQGLDALMSLAGYNQAEFAFEAGISPTGQSLRAYPTEKIIDSLQRAASERAAVDSATPAAHDLPRYIMGQPMGNLQASPEELSLLLQANGKRTVAEIAHHLNLPVHTVSATLAKFRLAGVVEFLNSASNLTAGNSIIPSEEPPSAAPQYWRGRRIN